MRRENSFVSKLITVVLGFVLFAYIGFQAYRAFYNPVETESAIFVEVDDSVQVSGYVVRDERTIIKNHGSGVLEVALFEGERVRNGDFVAMVHSTEESAAKNREVAEIDKKIVRVTALYAQSNESYDIDAANEKIAESAVNLVKLQYNGDFEYVKDRVEDLKFSTLIREYIYRDKNELLGVIDELKAEKSKLASAVTIKKRIYATDSGYFSGHTDGYETVLYPEKILNMTPSAFEEVCTRYAMASSDSVGKIIANNKWCFVATLAESKAKPFKTGKNVKLKFDDKHLPDVTAKIKSISDPEDGKVLMVFECDTNIADFTKARDVKANIVVTTYSGLRVPKEALRVNDEGQTGVYCLIDSQVKFKAINVIFEKENYYISEYDTGNTKSLLLYDEIVVSAKELENRKIIK